MSFKPAEKEVVSLRKVDKESKPRTYHVRYVEQPSRQLVQTTYSQSTMFEVMYLPLDVHCLLILVVFAACGSV